EVEPMRLLDMMEARQWQAALAMHSLHAAEARPDPRRAMIAAPTADEFLAIALAHEILLVANETHDRVIGLGAGIDEEDVVEPFGHMRRDLCRERGCRHRRRLEKRVVVRQIEHLPVGGLGQLLAAVTHIDAPQARHGIEQLVALRIPDPHPVGLRHNPRATFGMQGLVIGEGVEVMRGVLRDELGDIQVLGMDIHLSSPDWEGGREAEIAGGNDVLTGYIRCGRNAASPPALGCATPPGGNHRRLRYGNTYPDYGINFRSGANPP